MSATSLDLSDKAELGKIAEAFHVIARVAEKLGLRWYVVGASARDLLLWYGHGIARTRATGDVDIGVQIESWEKYEQLSNALLNDGAVQATKVRHKFFFHETIEVDVVPFGALARDGQLFWPDNGRTMSVVGFDEAYDSAIDVQLPGNVHVRVASIPGLLLLKIIAWEDRHQELRHHDALDIRELLLSYSSGWNLERLYESADDLLAHFNYDPELAGAALLGRDVAAIMRPKTKESVMRILLRETNRDGNLSLAVDMQREVEGNLQLLDALVYGIMLSGGKRMSPVHLIAEYQIGWRTRAPITRISVTFENDTGARSGADDFEPASVADAVAFVSILRLARPRFFDGTPKSIMTTKFDVANELTDPTRVPGRPLVREFDARWTAGAGGWILLRFANEEFSRFLYRFGGPDGAQFAAALAALEKPPAFFIPDVGVIRGVPEVTPPPDWGSLT